MSLVAALGSAGCDNPNYCAGSPNDDCRAIDAQGDGNVDTLPVCTSSAQCSAPAAVCDTTAGSCVECIAGTDASACTGTSPVCGGDYQCHGCAAHSECASAVCLPDGSCAAPSQVAYVSATGTGTACTQTTPCPLLADAVGKNLPAIKIAASGAAHASSTVVIDGKTVSIFAESGAILDRDGDGAILEVRSANANVAIYDLIFEGATSSSGNAVQLVPNGGSPALSLTRVTIRNNQGSGISTSGGSLTVARSTVTFNTVSAITVTNGSLTLSQSNVFQNQGGGISVSGTGASFAITNNYIFRNGDQDVGTYGGVNLGIATAGSNVFAFNTVVDNRSAINSGGVICNVAAFAAPNNIIARNSLAGSTTATGAQTSGACTYPTTLVQNDITGLNFASPGTVPYSYKLTAGSTAIDAATTSSTIAVDHDGDVRPQGGQKDCGADELVP